MPADFRVSITNAPGKGVYPISSFTWLLLYENPKDKAQAKVDGGLHEVGADRRPEVRRRARLRAAAEPVVKLELAALAKIKVSVGWRRHARAASGRGDLGFRLGTGAFALLLVADRRRRSAFELSRQSMLSIQKFGFSFWRTDDLGSGRRRVRRAARSSGARSTRRSWRCCIATPDRARHRHLHLRALPRAGCGSRWSSSPSCSRRFRRSSTASGASSCWCRPCARSRSRLPDVAAAAAALQRPAARRRHAVGGADPRDHGRSRSPRRWRAKC